MKHDRITLKKEATHSGWLNEGLVFLIAVSFVYTGCSKLFDLQSFAGDLNVELFPEAFLPLLIYGIPALELAVVILLYIPSKRMAGLYASITLLLLFSTYTALVLTGVFKTGTCGCTPGPEKIVWLKRLISGIVLLAITIAGTAMHIRPRSVQYLRALVGRVKAASP